MKRLFTFLCAVAVVAAAFAGDGGKQKPLRKAIRTERVAKPERISQKKALKAVPKSALDSKPLPFSRAEGDYDWQPLWTDVLSFITKGSVSAPVEIELDDEFNIPESVIGEAKYGFGGALLYEAGQGVMLIKYDDGNEEGMLWSPDVVGGDILYVEFDVRTAEDGISGCEVDFVLCDYEGGLDNNKCYDVSDQWKTLRYVFDTSEYTGEVLYFQLWPFAEKIGEEHDILIRNLNFEYVPAPPVEPIGAVENVEMGIDADGSLAVSWSAAAEANYYVAEVGRVHPVASGTDFTLVDADFSKIASTGTLETPEEDENLTVEVASFPGALFVLPVYVNGAIGVQDNFFYAYFMDYYAQLESGIYDLSAVKDGEIRFTLDVCSGTGANISAELYKLNDTADDWEVVDSFVKEEALATEFQTVEFSLKGAGEQSFFIIRPSGGEDYGYDGTLFFRSIKAEVTMSDMGEEISLPVLNWQGAETAFAIDSPVGGDTYFVTVTPYQITEDYEIKQEGEPTPVKYFAVPTQGIGSISTDANAAPVYYNLQGMRISAPAPGITIELRGSKAVKILR